MRKAPRGLRTRFDRCDPAYLGSRIQYLVRFRPEKLNSAAGRPIGLQSKVMTGVLTMHNRANTPESQDSTDRNSQCNVDGTDKEFRTEYGVLTIDLSHKLLSLGIVELGDFLLFESDPVRIRRRLPSFILWPHQYP